MGDWIIQFIADSMVFVIVVIAIVSLITGVANKQKFTVYSRILVAGLTSYLIAKLLATAYQPSAERPFELLGVDPGASYLDNPGFPSDHALFVWAIVFAVLFAVRRKWLGITLIVLAILVCIGRVLALVHTPLDVIGGFAAAAIGALWYLDTPAAHKPARRALAKK